MKGDKRNDYEFLWGYWILQYFDEEIGYFEILDGYTRNFPTIKYLLFEIRGQIISSRAKSLMFD